MPFPYIVISITVLEKRKPGLLVWSHKWGLRPTWPVCRMYPSTSLPKLNSGMTHLLIKIAFDGALPYAWYTVSPPFFLIPSPNPNPPFELLDQQALILSRLYWSAERPCLQKEKLAHPVLSKDTTLACVPLEFFHTSQEDMFQDNKESVSCSPHIPLSTQST